MYSFIMSQEKEYSLSIFPGTTKNAIYFFLPNALLVYTNISISQRNQVYNYECLIVLLSNMLLSSIKSYVFFVYQLLFQVSTQRF